MTIINNDECVKNQSKKKTQQQNNKICPLKEFYLLELYVTTRNKTSTITIGYSRGYKL